MSYYPFDTTEKTNKFNSENFSKKDKFIDTKDKNFLYDTPGFWNYEKKIIDNESQLKNTNILNKTKTEIQLTEHLHPNNYNISISNQNKNLNEEKLYYSGYDTGPGRGFGNLSVSNSIRVGDFTRIDTKDKKENKEKEIINRWDFIDNRFQNIKILPRGGETTRRKNEKDTNEFEFKY